MKNIKFILFSIIIVLYSCNDDDNNNFIAFDFTLSNLSGNYEINSYNADLTFTSNTTSGNDAVFATAVKVGDTFQIDIILNENGTYSAQGQYRVVTTETQVGGGQTQDEEILNVNNEGTFTISSIGARTITFVATSGDFLDGEYRVNLFNEDGITLIQDKSESDSNITTQTITNIALGRE